MPLELHIWGPALELPSIDPECLAALSCFAYAVPLEHWTLIASNDTTVSPDHILPALCHNDTWTSGYLNIISYLAGLKTLNPIDDDLTQGQQADALAYASYLTSRGAALLAFSLYVSPSAWADVTRPAYSNLLPFPLTWTVPTSLRAAAVTKTVHLGLDRHASEVDPEDGLAEGNIMAPTTSTGFLKLPTRPSLSATMQPEQTAAIRLQSLIDDFFSVLDDLRGDKKFFFGANKPSSLDFLVFSYLRLMQVETPHPFFAKRMKSTDTGLRLMQFLDGMNAGPIRWPQNKTDEELPWASSPRGIVGIAGRFAGDVVESLPGVGEAWKKWWRGGVQGEDDKTQNAYSTLLAVSSAATGLGAVGAVLLFRALAPFGSSIHRFGAPKVEKQGLHQFGDIGCMFDSLPSFEPPPRSSGRDTLYKDKGVEVAVEVESEGPGTQPQSPRDGNYAEVGVGVRVGDRTA